MSITVHIKNMAGEITSLEVPQGTKVWDLPQHLSDMDEKQFPYFRTKVMRMEQEEKEEMREEVMEGDVLISFVSAVSEMTQKLPEKINLCAATSSEKPTTRLVLPIGRESLFIYPRSMYTHRVKGRTIHCEVEHYIPCSAQYPKPLHRSQIHKPYLALAIREFVPTITAPQMEAIHEIVRQYYRELDPQNKENFQLEYPPSETYPCGCGSVIKGSSTASHIKTKKHQAYLESLKQ